MTAADRASWSGVTLALAAGAAAILTGLVSSWSSLAYDWNWDDLHLIRAYAPAELAGTWVSNWDPDGIETAGFRPLTTAFNHLRAAAFGEWLTGHRLFLLALYGAGLGLMADLVRRLGAPPAAAVIGAVFAIVAKNSYYHYVWVADGVHVLQLLFGVLALRSGRSYVEAGRRGSLAGALAWFSAALLTREDSLALVPVMVVLAAGPEFPWRRARAGLAGPNGGRLRRLTVGLAVLLPAWWLWRLAAVTSAPNFKLEWAAVERIVQMMRWTVSLVGAVDPAWPGFVVLAVALALATRWLPASDRRLALMLLVLALVTCTIGNVRARANLVMLPAMLYGFFLGVAGVGLARRRRAVGPVAALAGVVAVVLSVRASRLEQLDLHPMSAGQIGREWQFISGRLGDATIPEVRRRRLEPKLESLGLLRLDADLSGWRQSILERRRLGPQSDGGVFHPPRAFLEAELNRQP